MRVWPQKDQRMRQYSECYEALIPSELRVVQALVAGYTTDKVIAKHLGISRRTIQTHLAMIYSKLNIENRVDLVLYALRAGWFDCYGNKKL